MTSDRSCLEPSEAVRRNRAEDFGLDLSGFSPQALDDLTARFATGTMGAFTDTLAKVGYCSRPGAARRLLCHGRQGHGRGARHLLLARRATRGDLRGMRQPPRLRVRRLLAPLRRRHLPDASCGCRWWQAGARARPRQPAALRDAHRSELRRGPSRVVGTSRLPTGGRTPTVPPRGLPELPSPRRRGSRRLPAVPGLLRLHHSRRVAVARAGTLATVRHPPSSSRRPPAGGA